MVSLVLPLRREGVVFYSSTEERGVVYCSSTEERGVVSCSFTGERVYCFFLHVEVPSHNIRICLFNCLMDKSCKCYAY